MVWVVILHICLLLEFLDLGLVKYNFEEAKLNLCSIEFYFNFINSNVDLFFSFIFMLECKLKRSYSKRKNSICKFVHMINQNIFLSYRKIVR